MYQLLPLTAHVHFVQYLHISKNFVVATAHKSRNYYVFVIYGNYPFSPAQRLQPQKLRDIAVINKTRKFSRCILEFVSLYFANYMTFIFQAMS